MANIRHSAIFFFLFRNLTGHDLTCHNIPDKGENDVNIFNSDHSTTIHLECLAELGDQSFMK